MKNIFKRIFSLLLVLIFVFGTITVAYAGEIDVGETTTQPSDEEIIKIPSDDDVIGKIYLCSRWSKITTTGHIWIYILNNSDETLKAGLYDLEPGEGVSLATFGFTRSDGFGIYYNMEAYRNDKYCDESCISIEDDLTRYELEKITEALLVSNHWNPIYNCVFFACKIWNIGGNRYILPFFYPPVTRLQIMMCGGKEPCQMEYQPPENSYKQRGFGENAYLENVSQKSLEAK